jgi:hypothetical protein
LLFTSLFGAKEKQKSHPEKAGGLVVFENNFQTG